MGFDNALVQEIEARDFYRPDFDRGREPFADAESLKPKPAISAVPDRDRDDSAVF